ncbi:MAG: DUF721 domain-containing protein [Bacteroidales bacterium]|jgi:hypothetical protein|nr:DUF721 domain-containing protein [Bacteroidales bacterium]
MEKINHIFKDIIEKYHLKDDFNRFQAMKIFKEIIGEKMANKILEIKIRHKILIVKFSSPSLKNDFIYKTNDILEQINRQIGEKVINNIAII